MKLYVSDLDGTLLNGQAQLSEYSLRELIRLLKEGLLFTVASARSVVSMQSLLRGLKLPLPVIEFNGAFISDLGTGRHLICNAIERTIVDEIMAMAHAQNLQPFVSSFDGLDDRLRYVEPVNRGGRWYVNDRMAASDSRLQQVDDLSPYLHEQVVCLTLIEQQGVLEPFAEHIRKTFGECVQLHHIENFYSPGWFWLTVHDRRATKAWAMKCLADEHGIDLAEVTAFGDGVNDISIFRLVGRGIAVHNADEELKCHAAEVIGSNEEDSVVKYLENAWKG